MKLVVGSARLKKKDKAKLCERKTFDTDCVTSIRVFRCIQIVSDPLQMGLGRRREG